ncbi:MAG: protein translocase subunit SecF [Acutalibacteraceae bacterium]
MRNKKTFDFVGKLKIFLCISALFIIFGIVMNFVLGIKLDIDFSGGTTLSYSHTGEVDTAKAKSAIEKSVKYNVNVAESRNYTTGSSMIVVSVLGNKALTVEDIDKITKSLTDEFKDNKIEQLEQNSVDPTVGSSFFAKSMYGLALACLLVAIYVGFRFRKIGGVPAAITAIIALIHDVAIAYFAYVLLGYTIGGNFIAVMLTILGYSLNDTIVIYDRIRENSNVYNGTKSIREITNISITQSFRRTMITSITTFIAITCVTVVAAASGLTSILSFSIPMSIGIISGTYTSTCISGPLYVAWMEAIEKHSSKGGKKKTPAYVNSRK